MAAIGALSIMPKPAIYRRADGELYAKLNEKFHVKTKFGEDKDGKPAWLGNGTAEELDPTEEVEVVA